MKLWYVWLSAGPADNNGETNVLHEKPGGQETSVESLSLSDKG